MVNDPQDPNDTGFCLLMIIILAAAVVGAVVCIPCPHAFFNY